MDTLDWKLNGQISNFHSKYEIILYRMGIVKVRNAIKRRVALFGSEQFINSSVLGINAFIFALLLAALGAAWWADHREFEAEALRTSRTLVMGGVGLILLFLATGSVWFATREFERRRNRATRKIEASLIQAQRLAKLGYWSLDHASGEFEWSAEIPHLLEIDIDGKSLTHDEFLSLCHPEDRSAVAQRRAAADEKHSPYDIVDKKIGFRLLMPDGRVKWVEAVLQTEYGPKGAAVKTSGVTQDITERKLVEEELRKIQASLMEAQRIAKLGSWTFNHAEGKFECSEEILRVLERDFDKDLLTHEKFLSFCHPEDRPLIAKRLVAAGKRHSPNEVVEKHVAYRVLMPNGRIKWVNSAFRTEYGHDGMVVTSRGVIQDITESRQVEEALRESRESLVEAQALAKMGSWKLDLLTNTLEWSDEIFRIFEVERDSFGASYEAFLGFCHPDDREMVDQTYTNSVSARAPYRVIHRLLMADGRVKWVEERGRTEYDATGAAIRSTGTVQDITERRKSEEVLRETQASLIQAQGIAKIASWSLDHASRKYEWSEEVFRLLERDIDKDALTFERFLSFCHPEDRLAMAQLRASADEERSPRVFAAKELEYRLLMPDGRVKWMSGRSHTDYGPDGRAIRSRGVIQDITESKQAERALRESRRLLIEAQALAKIGSWTIDRLTDTWDLSDETYRLFEVARDDFVASSRTLNALCHPDDRSRIVEAYKHSMTERAPYSVTHRILVGGGRIKWVEARGRAEFDAAGEIVRLSGTVQDITEQRQAEEALRETQLSLIQAQRTAKLGSWSKDHISGRYLWSDEILRVLERDLDKSLLTYDNILSFCHAEDRLILEKARSAINGIHSPREIGENEVVYRMLMPDGAIKWVDARTRTEYGADGAAVRTSGVIQDITERKQAEEALRESRELLIEAQSLAKIGSWNHDIFSNTSTWSDELYRILEIEREQFSASRETLNSFFHPDDLEIVYKTHAEAVATRVPYKLVHRLLLEDGRIKWAESRGQIEYDEVGRAIRSTGTVQDITASKQVELAMETVSKDLQALDGGLYYETAVRRLAELTGAETAFITRLDSVRRDELNAVAVVEDGVVGQNYRYSISARPCAEVLSSGMLVVSRGVQSHFPGDERLVEKTIEAFAGAALADRTGRPLGVIGVMARTPFRDGETVAKVIRILAVAVAATMEREQNRRQFADLFEFAPDGLLLVDEEGRISHVNRQAEQIFGWTRGELSGYPVEMLVPQRARDHHVNLRQGFHTMPTWRRMAAGRRAVTGRRKDGSEFPAEIDLAPVASEGGFMIAAAVRDISERRMLEEQLAQSTKMEAIGKLTGGMAHDFNNYLGIIISNLDLLAPRVTTDAGSTKLVNAALHGALRGAELIQSLVAFARRQPLAPHITDIEQLLKAVGSLLNQTLGEDIAVTVIVEPNLWPVRIDGSQLESSLLNLANNSRDAMPRGGDLAISARNFCIEGEAPGTLLPEIANGEYVLIEISDTGVGMTSEVLAHAFEPFFSTKPPGHGSGLGLSMVFGFIKQSGGHIQVRSEVDNGTTMQLYLPAAKEQTAIENRPLAFRQDTVPGGMETILVVEDKEEMRSALVNQLESLGYRVVEAETGAVALTILEDQGAFVNLLFTDVVMPGRPDGYELAAIARERYPNLKVLLTSGFPGHQVRQRDLNTMDIKLLRKPYRRSELAKTIRAVLDVEVPSLS